MSAIGLDISTDCGIAFWPRSIARPIWKTLKLPGEPGEVGRPCEKLRAALADYHQLEPITHFFFEATLLPPPAVNDEGRAYQRTSPQTVYKLCALAGMAEWFGYRIDAHVRQVEQQRWRKHFIGKGTGKTKELKQLAIAKCHSLDWMVSDDHQAEAIGVLDFGLTCAGISPPWRDAHLFAPAVARAR